MSDCISREAAIKAVEELHDCYNGFSDTFDKACIIGVLEEVPPVREVKRGHWIGIDDEPHETWECDQCGFIEECFDGDQWKFCPNCGARMEERHDA